MTTTAIRFDPQWVRVVPGGVVVDFDSAMVPARAEVMETASTVTITLFSEQPSRRHRARRFAHHQVFVPLDGPAAYREVIDGSYLANLNRTAA
ncbi:MAG TPA: hypothetical protein VL856_18215 [Acidimicrobiia bacterium]|jgi:hypothetical protein|nr:hypothetical protein [Acidimicrobiia bacterium]